jgi:hypothetical protein
MGYNAASLVFFPGVSRQGNILIFKVYQVHKELFFLDVTTLEDETAVSSRNFENQIASEPVSHFRRTVT